MKKNFSVPGTGIVLLLAALFCALFFGCEQAADTTPDVTFSLDLAFGGYNTTAIFNETKGTFTAVEADTSSEDGRVAKAGGKTVATGHYTYIPNKNTPSDSLLFIDILQMLDSRGNFGNVRKDTIYSTPIDLENSTEETSVLATESSKETIDYVKSGKELPVYELEVTQGDESNPGFYLKFNTHPERHYMIQFTVRNKTTGMYYLETRVPDAFKPDEYYGNCYDYYYPFVNEGDEYQFYGLIWDEQSQKIVYSTNIVDLVAQTGKSELVLKAEIPENSVSVDDGVVTISDIPDLLEIEGAVYDNIRITFYRYDSDGYEHIWYRVYSPDTKTISIDTKKWDSSTLRKIAKKDYVFLQIQANLSIDENSYNYMLLNEMPFTYFKDYEGIVDSLDWGKAENGILFTITSPCAKESNFKIPYYYIGVRNGIYIDGTYSKLDENGQLQLLYPFVEPDNEYNFDIYIQFEDYNVTESKYDALYTNPVIYAEGGYKGRDYFINIEENEKFAIKLSNGTEDGTNVRLLKMKGDFAAVTKSALELKIQD